MADRDISVNKQNDPSYEAMLDDLIQEVFGFSFAPWFERKLWDGRYESYSIIENGKMLSNVCIFKAELLIGGESVAANQFGAVATRESVRGRGLSRRLMAHVLSLYPTTLAYLAANQGVIDFYPRFGFRQIQTYKARVNTAINNDPVGAVKVSVGDELLTRALYGRRVYSRRVDCLNAQPVQMFHLLMTYADDIYYLPGCKAFVIASQKDSRLFIADVIAQSALGFDALVSELPFNGINTVAFGFCPDWLGIEPKWAPVRMTDEPFFVKGDWKLPDRFRFPLMSET